MKKMLCLVLSLMLLLSCSALAEEEKEITFQGVPWGSSKEETRQIWIDQGFVKPNPPAGSGSNGNYGFSFSAEGDLVYFSGSDDTMCCHSFKISALEVTTLASYELNKVCEFYACDRVEDGTALMMVLVELKVSDGEAAYDDLTAKLASIYGQYEGLTWEDYGMVVNMWKGANNTVVVLAPDGNTGLVTLLYGTLDAEKILGEYEDRYQATIPTPVPVDPTDTSGL